MSDSRRLGRIRLQRRPEAERPLAGLGFDVLEGLPPPLELAALLARRRGPVKAVLLDQSLFAGVGNWIADEALYQAAIDPRRPAASLELPEVTRLRARLLAIVRLRRRWGGRPPLPRSWLFHHRWAAQGARTAQNGSSVRSAEDVPSRLPANADGVYSDDPLTSTTRSNRGGRTRRKPSPARSPPSRWSRYRASQGPATSTKDRPFQRRRGRSSRRGLTAGSPPCLRESRATTSAQLSPTSTKVGHRSASRL
jgi:formamidopyrimidine-DNA glycosylase